MNQRPETIWFYKARREIPEVGTSLQQLQYCRETELEANGRAEPQPGHGMSAQSCQLGRKGSSIPRSGQGWGDCRCTDQVQITHLLRKCSFQASYLGSGQVIATERRHRKRRTYQGQRAFLFSSCLFTSVTTAWQDAPVGESIHVLRPEAFSSGLEEGTEESCITAFLLRFPLYQLV